MGTLEAKQADFEKSSEEGSGKLGFDTRMIHRLCDTDPLGPFLVINGAFFSYHPVQGRLSLILGAGTRPKKEVLLQSKIRSSHLFPLIVLNWVRIRTKIMDSFFDPPAFRQYPKSAIK